MVAIQIVLIVTALVLFVVFTQRSHTVRTQAVKRIAFILFMLLSIYAVLRPNDVNWVAHRLGVGRGADLLLYMMVVGFAFFAVNTFLRFRTLERRFTDLARSVALSNAVAPEAVREPGAAGAVVDGDAVVPNAGGVLNAAEAPAAGQDAEDGQLMQVVTVVAGAAGGAAPTVPAQGRRAT